MPETTRREFRSGVVGHTLDRNPMIAIFDGKWKLLTNPDRSRVELYDIPADPSELCNLAEREPKVAERLTDQALPWIATLPPGRVEPEAGKNDYRWPKGSKG